MRRGQPEAVLQGAVVAFLRQALPARAIVFHPPNGGCRDKREAAKLKWQGVLPGVPDVIVILDGRTFGVELKSARGKLSDEQRNIADRFQDNGCPWTCARSIEQVEQFLRSHGVALKATTLARPFGELARGIVDRIGESIGAEA